MEFIYKDIQITTEKNTLEKQKIPDKPNNSNSSSSTSNCGRNKKFIVIFIILGIAVVGTVIFLIVHFTKKKSEEISSGQIDYTESNGDGDGEEESTPPSNPTEEVEEEQKPIQLEELPLEKEFEILTKVGLRKFKVVQNSIEENKINGNLITTKIKRITNYDVYILK